MRKGIALLITIIVISALAGIIYLTTKYIAQAKKTSNSVENLMQVSLIASDISVILKKLLRDVNSSSELSDIYGNPIPFELKKQNTLITTTLNANSAVINLNLLPKPNGELDEIYERVWVNIMESYEIKDPTTLTNLVVDTIKKKRYDEKRLLFIDGKIVNMKHFTLLLEDYYKITSDKRVFKVPWSEFIGFENKVIDFNFVSPSLLAFMDEMISIDRAKEIMENGSYSKLEDINIDSDTIARLKKYPFSFFVPRFKCSSRYVKGDYEVEFEFDYDKAKGVSGFEILGKI